MAMAVVILSAVFPLLNAKTPDFKYEVSDRFGATVKVDTTDRTVYLVFSADSLFEGAPEALNTLDSLGVKASFFFTGNFLERPENRLIVERVIKSGHYVGPHSGRHILLSDWDANRTPLVTPDSMMTDFRLNYRLLNDFGIKASDAGTVLPPFEWCGKIHTERLRKEGLVPINITPGVNTYRDYTVPGMAEYHTSEDMYNQLFDYESKHGLNGYIIIFHLGTQDLRTDKLYHRLPLILTRLRSLGYKFGRF